MRLTIAALLCLGLLLGFTGGANAAEKTIEGKVCCAKCELKEAPSCNIAVVVKEDGKDVTYYFDKASSDKYHKEYCKKTAEAKVTGEVSEKEGKKIIKVSKLETK